MLQHAEELLDGGRPHALLLLLRSRNQAAQAAMQLRAQRGTVAPCASFASACAGPRLHLQRGAMG